LSMPDGNSLEHKPDKSILIDTAGLRREGHAWVAEIPAGYGPSDTPGALTASRFVLYENDQELGPAHSLHDTIRQVGRGAYSHWDSSLYFSTSDRSDPRTNGRTYRLAPKSLRLAVIGLDGTDPLTLRQHIAKGRLPNIAKLLARSREVEVRSESELFLNSFWPCFGSGLSVGSHGVHAFRAPRSGTVEIVEREQQRMSTPFWETAARRGIRTCVLDVPFYGPPAAEKELKPLSYVEWGPHPVARPPASMPPGLIKRVLDRHGYPPCTMDLPDLPTIQASADQLALLCIGIRKRGAVISDLIRMTNPELMVAIFPEVHTAGHQWLNQETPDHRCYDAAMLEAIGSPTTQVYEALDRTIGELIDQLPPDTTVLLTCLAGVRPTHGGSYLLYDLLDRLGVSVLPGRGDHSEPWNDDGSIEGPPDLYFDWSRTRAFALPWSYDGYLRINQRGREPTGIVEAGDEREQLLAEIERVVHRLRIAGTDEPAAKAVIRAQDEFPGAASSELPDLMVLWNNGRPLDAVESELVGRIDNRDPAGRCRHGTEGGIFACGPLIAAGPTVRGARDFDIAPTVLRLLGLDVPNEYEGRTLSDLIASGSSLSTVVRLPEEAV
jgi:predicted AlkP superfamily phosphohydrolase/phosphomutase